MQMRRSWAALAAVVAGVTFASEPVAPEPPKQIPNEVGAGIGAQGIGFSFAGGRWGDLFAMPALEARGAWGFLAGDANVLLTIPVSAGGAGFGARATVRAGYTNDRFAILLGPSFDYGSVADPALQLLPSLRAQASFGSWGLSFGLFDHNALAPVHLTAEVGDWGVGFVGPVGVTGHIRFWLTPRIALRVQALAATILNVPQAWVHLGVVFRPSRGQALSGGTP